MLLRSIILGLGLALAVGFAPGCEKSGGGAKESRSPAPTPTPTSMQPTKSATPAPISTPAISGTPARPSSQQPPPCAGTTFTSCGGALVGTWKFSADCIDLPPKFAAGPPGSNDPTGGSCPSATGRIIIDVSGSVTFKADMTYAVDIDAPQTTAEFTVPKTCLAAGKACADLDEAAIDAGKICKLRRSEAGPPSKEAGEYAVDTTNYTFTATKGGPTTGSGSASDAAEREAFLPPGKPNPYCVSGSTAKIRTVDGQGNAIILLLKK